MNGNNNGFRPDELVKIQGRDFVMIGGRLRVLHSAGTKVSITTEVIDYALDEYAVVRARVVTEGGEFSGTGVASAGRDPKLQDALLELAETRSVARALRFAGIGVECCGLEEVAGREHEDLVSFPRERVKESPPARDDAWPARIVAGPPATAAQLRCIRTMAKRLQMDPHVAVARLAPGVELDHLTLGAASEIIDELQKKSTSGNGVRNAGEPPR